MTLQRYTQNPILIEKVTPSVDNGVFAPKAIVGETIVVEADIFKDGLDLLRAQIKSRHEKEKGWNTSVMHPTENDRWRGSFTVKEKGRTYFTVEAWVDPLATWIEQTKKKCLANQTVSNEVSEGGKLFGELLQKLPAAEIKKAEGWLAALEKSNGIYDEVLRLLKMPLIQEWVEHYPLYRRHSTLEPALSLIVDRKKAEFSAWYELFPRSQGKKSGVHGTFRDCVARLDDIEKMGFDVIYLPPIHPIGMTKRKGKNNALLAQPQDPGCPWAIGNKEGGHKAIHPELGTLEDFKKFIQEGQKRGIEIALDLAFQCSPDHPYVKEHPDWFYRYPDGHIHFAENPPKKYEDIYPLNFNCEEKEALWEELKSVVIYWVEQGVKIFRVDNPHTKPFKFWQWLIAEVRHEHPEVIFLAEAFTRPKPMNYLAKLGFTQSYTYFTWRNTKQELREYLEELTQTEMKNYFRGNFFANTPDILHEYLQTGGVAAFKIRALLAATLSSNWGIYSGFELCENTPKHPGSEEYFNSEKYEIKVRNWDQPGNIKNFIAKLNGIRKENVALQQTKNLTFFTTRNDQVLAYGKKTADNQNCLVVVVNIDPHHTHEDLVSLPLNQFGLEPWQTYQMKDLLSGEKYHWKGGDNYIRLNPAVSPAHIFELKKS